MSGVVFLQNGNNPIEDDHIQLTQENGWLQPWRQGATGKKAVLEQNWLKIMALVCSILLQPTEGEVEFMVQHLVAGADLKVMAAVQGGAAIHQAVHLQMGAREAGKASLAEMMRIWTSWIQQHVHNLNNHFFKN
mgnify:CR=1 FL=1